MTLRTLVLFAHPALERSRVHRRLAPAAAGVEGVTLHDLYQAYPDLDVLVEREQALLEASDAVVMQFPFYWYSTPPLLKQWQDLVLRLGWAFGPGGDALAQKPFLCAVSTGGSAASYGAGGHNRYTMRELLRPLEQTARLCGMQPLAPFVVHGANELSDPEIEEAARGYARVREALVAERLDLEAAAAAERLDPAQLSLRREP
jgi:glutathione-regulated potassium-efflux system ancillary protein KefG